MLRYNVTTDNIKYNNSKEAACYPEKASLRLSAFKRTTNASKEPLFVSI